MFIRATIPSFRHVGNGHAEDLINSPGSTGGSTPSWKSYFVYQMDVLVAVSSKDTECENVTGNSLKTRYFRLEKRYSDFLALHNELRRVFRTPEFPPKKLNNTSRKLLEMRRLMLEKYIQALCRYSPIPSALLLFLGLPEYSSRPVSLDQSFTVRPPTSHGAVIGFSEAKPFLLEAQHHHRLLPDIVSQATIDFFYRG